MRIFKILILIGLFYVPCSAQQGLYKGGVVMSTLMKTFRNQTKEAVLHINQGFKPAVLTIRALPQVNLQRKYWDALYRLPMSITPTFVESAHQITPSSVLLADVSKQAASVKNTLTTIQHYMTKVAKYERLDVLYETEKGEILQNEILAIPSLSPEAKESLQESLDNYDTESVLGILADYYSLNRNYAFVQNMEGINPLLKHNDVKTSFVEMAIRYMFAFPGKMNFRLQLMMESPLVSKQLKDELSYEMEHLKQSRLTTEPVRRILTEMYDQYAKGYTGAKLSRSQTELVALYMRLRAELEQFVANNGRIPTENAQDIAEVNLLENINSLLSEYTVSKGLEIYLDPIIDKEVERISNLLGKNIK